MDDTHYVTAANAALSPLLKLSQDAPKELHEGDKITVAAALERILALGTQISESICNVVNLEGRDTLLATACRTACVDIVPARIVDGKLAAYACFIKDTKWGKVMLFPGGKLQQDDASLLQAAGRELEEETELALAERIKPIGIVDVPETKGRLPFAYMVSVSDEEMKKMRAASDLESATLVWTPMQLMQYVAQTEGERKEGRIGHMEHRALVLGLNDKFGADFSKYQVTQAPKTFAANSVQLLRHYEQQRAAQVVPEALIVQIEKTGQLAAEALSKLTAEEGLKWKTVSDDVFKGLEKKWLRPLVSTIAQYGQTEKPKAAWPEDQATFIGSLPCHVVIETGEKQLRDVVRLNETIADAAFRVFATQGGQSLDELEQRETTVTVQAMKRAREGHCVDITCSVKTLKPEEKKVRSDEK